MSFITDIIALGIVVAFVMFVYARFTGKTWKEVWEDFIDFFHPKRRIIGK
jgi:hypothetical protein